tara:strand:- start:306 stop:410 length:105 start_codon:yes stop_codon:yes gene_type:complete
MNILDDELISEWVESLEEINQIYGKRESKIFPSL